MSQLQVTTQNNRSLRYSYQSSTWLHHRPRGGPRFCFYLRMPAEWSRPSALVPLGVCWG